MARSRGYCQETKDIEPGQNEMEFRQPRIPNGLNPKLKPRYQKYRQAASRRPLSLKTAPGHRRGSCSAIHAVFVHPRKAQDLSALIQPPIRVGIFPARFVTELARISHTAFAASCRLRRPAGCSASRLSPVDFTLFRLSALRSDSLRLRARFLAASRDEAV